MLRLASSRCSVAAQRLPRSFSSAVGSSLSPTPRSRQQLQKSLESSVGAFMDIVRQLRRPRSDAAMIGASKNEEAVRTEKAPPLPPSPLDALQHASPAAVIKHVRSLSAAESDGVMNYCVGRRRLQAAVFVFEALGPGGSPSHSKHHNHPFVNPSFVNALVL